MNPNWKGNKITLPSELPSERTIAAFILLAFWPFPSLVRFLFPISIIRMSTEMATKQTLLLLANSSPLVVQGAQMQRLWADTGFAPPARTPRLWHQVPTGAPPRGGHRIRSCKAPQVMLDLEPGTQLLCLQQRSVIWFDTLHVFFAQIRSFFCSCSTTPLSLEMINSRPCGDGLIFPVPIISGEGWSATKHCGYWRDGVMIVAALAQSPVWVLCP